MDTAFSYRSAMLATLVLGLAASDRPSASAAISKPFAPPAERHRANQATERRVGLALDRAVESIADGFRGDALNR